LEVVRWLTTQLSTKEGSSKALKRLKKPPLSTPKLKLRLRWRWAVALMVWAKGSYSFLALSGWPLPL